MKTYHLLRHAQAVHTVLAKEMGSFIYTNPLYRDCSLTPRGVQECQTLQSEWKQRNEITLVVTSPLKRCLETTYHLFSDVSVPILVMDECLEYPQGLHYSNKRSNLDELQLLYPTYCFDFIQFNYYPGWSILYEESYDEATARLSHLDYFLQQQVDTNIAIVSDSYILNILENLVNPDNCLDITREREFGVSPILKILD